MYFISQLLYYGSRYISKSFSTSDLDLSQMTLDEGHDELPGHMQPLCQVLSKYWKEKSNVFSVYKPIIAPLWG